MVKTAGLIGRHFGIDPLQVLNGDYKDYAIRVGAFRYSKTKEKEVEEAKAKAMNNGRGRRGLRHR